MSLVLVLHVSDVFLNYSLFLVDLYIFVYILYIYLCLVFIYKLTYGCLPFVWLAVRWACDDSYEIRQHFYVARLLCCVVCASR